MKNNLQSVPHTFLSLILWLLLMASGTTLFAKPRGAMPPAPESHLLLLRFDTVTELIATNKAPLALEGVTSSESWSGYSLHVGGEKPARIAFPEINASGKTNLSFNRGAVRFWFKPDWSSESSGGKGPGTDARLFSLTGGETKAGVNERALLFDPTGSALYFSDVNRATLLQTKISWPASQWHQVVLNYSADGTALYLDGELVAKGEGVSAWPALKEPRAFTIGSDLNGENLAQGDFEEFTTFAKNLTAEEISWNYRMFTATAALGAITPEEEAAKKQNAKSGGQSSQQRTSLAPPGGGGTNNFGGGSNFTYTNAQTGLRLVNPAWQSNQFTAQIAGGEAVGRYDLFHTTNLTVWDFVLRTAPGQTNLAVNLFADPPGFFLLGTMQDTDGDTLTDAYESLVSKTSPAGYDTYDSVGGTGTTATLFFDEPAVLRISQVNVYEEFAPHCPVIPSVVAASGTTKTLAWSFGQGGSALNIGWFLNCPGNGHIGNTYGQTIWNSNGVATCETWYAGQSHVTGTNCSAPPTNFPAEYCLLAAAAGDNTFIRTAATAVQLATGGKELSLSSNLFLIHVTATERTNTPLTGSGLTIGLKATNITFTDITVLGRSLDTNGDLFIGLLDRQTNNITPVLSTNHSNYVFTVTATKIRIPLTFRNSGALINRETNGFGYDAGVYDIVTNLVTTNYLGLVNTTNGYWGNFEETSAIVPTNSIFDTGLLWHRDVADQTYFYNPVNSSISSAGSTNFISSPPGSGPGNDDGGDAEDVIPDKNRLIINCDFPNVLITNALPAEIAPPGTICIHRFFAREWVTLNGMTISEILRWRSSILIRRKADLSWERIGSAAINFISLTPDAKPENPTVTEFEFQIFSAIQ